MESTVSTWFVKLLMMFASIAIGVFIYLSFDQLNLTLSEIKQGHIPLTKEIISSVEQKTELIIRASLEYDYQAYKQHNLESFIATRTWMRFMSLVFGAIVIAVGSIFILGKINSPPIEINGENKGVSPFKLSIMTSSPGIIMVILGMILISIPNLSPQNISTVDKPLYFSLYNQNLANGVDQSQHETTDFSVSDEELKALKEMK